MDSNNIYPIDNLLISKVEKERLLGQIGSVFWLYGLSGSGKSTLAIDLERRLYAKKIHSILLDGDNLRSGLNQDLGFSQNDRNENIRRVSEVAKLLVENGLVVIVSLITPLREFRNLAAKIIGESNFHEIFIKASFSVCQDRDVKGLYAKAENGEVNTFTGKDSDFEEPLNGCLTINTEKEKPEVSSDKLFNYILESISPT